MKLCDRTSGLKQDPVPHRLKVRAGRSVISAFSLLEVMVVMGLLMILIVSGFSAILSMRMTSNRLADYTAAMAVVEAKVEDIRAATYNPPNYPFGSSTITLTNSGAVALNKAGAAFLVPGTVVSKIQPVSTGHLITVTGTFKALHRPITVTLQTVVNRYSGGQQ